MIKYARLTLQLREVIENMQADGHGQKASTLAVGVDQSTVFRALDRNGEPRRHLVTRMRSTYLIAQAQRLDAGDTHDGGRVKDMTVIVKRSADGVAAIARRVRAWHVLTITWDSGKEMSDDQQRPRGRLEQRRPADHPTGLRLPLTHRNPRPSDAVLRPDTTSTTSRTSPRMTLVHAGRATFRESRRALDRDCFVVQNRGVLVEFTQSARKHRIGRARVRQVLADPVAEATLPAGGDRQERLVIHAMDLRPKWRHLYEEGKR